MDYDLNSSIIPTQEGRAIHLTRGTGLKAMAATGDAAQKARYAARRLGIEWKPAEDGGVVVRFPDADGDYNFVSIEAAIVHQVATGA